MRTTGCIMLALVLGGGCTRLNPAFLGERGATDSTSDSTTDSATGTSDVTGGPTTGDTSDGTDGGTGSTTGGMACTYESAGRLNAKAVANGQEMGWCGEPFETWGLIIGQAPGVLTFQVCQDAGCGQCDQLSFDLELSAPVGRVPDIFADCTRVRIEREYFDDLTQDCLFSGIVLSAQDAAQVVIPYLIGSSQVVDPPDGLTFLSQNLTVLEHEVDLCDCPDCCDGLAAEYDLEFTLGNVNVTIPPTQSQSAMVTDIEYQLWNLQSHDALLCGDPPDIDWSVVDTAFLN